MDFTPNMFFSYLIQNAAADASGQANSTKA